MMRAREKVVAVLLAVLTAGAAHALPATIAYQGELRAGGDLFDGTASLKAAIVDGGATLWSNDGTSSTGAEPTGAVSVTVTGGIFSVHLGDIAQGMVPLDPAAFGPGVGAPALRLWVDTGGGFEQLPDQLLAASLFAISAETASGALADFNVEGQLFVGPAGVRFDDGTVMTSAATGGGSLWQENGSAIYWNTGNVGVGTSTPDHRFEVLGSAEFDLPNGAIQVTTPGGWPGFIGYSVNGHRRDVIFDDAGMRLLTGDSSSPPISTNGIIISEQGELGVLKYPAYPLDVLGDARLQSLIVGDDTNTSMTTYLNGAGGILRIFNNAPTATAQIEGGGASGGGKLTLFNGTDPANPTVSLVGNDGNGGRVELRNNVGAVTMTSSGQAYASGSQTRYYRADGVLGIEITAGVSEMKCFDANGTLQTWITGDDGGGNGRVRTDIVEITGGSDLSERFDVGGNLVQPGMVVAIDRHHPGRLVLSEEPYQKTVAGVISGAGGVRTGMVMGQAGTLADGAHPVALTGRVWAWCDADGGAIEPGDLLTTSRTAGHAMRVADHDRAHGAVLGKAMSPLAGGRGLVLVLVGLQ